MCVHVCVSVPVAILAPAISAQARVSGKLLAVISQDTNQGVGLIFPPADIRGVIDKTARFVAEHGPEFEQRALREQSHTKFAFLLPNNPYRAYYEHKVKELKTGVVEEKKPVVPEAIIQEQQKEAEKAKKKQELKAITDGTKKKNREAAAT